MEKFQVSSYKLQVEDKEIADKAYKADEKLKERVRESIIKEIWRKKHEVRESMLEISVITYSGFKADERPVSFLMGKREVQVSEIYDSWYGPDSVSFKIKGDDGNIYILKQDKSHNRWELDFFLKSELV